MICGLGGTARYLASSLDCRGTLREAGLDVIQWEDVSQPSLQWFDAVTQQLAESGPPPLGLHLLMGEAAPTKLGNVGKNLQENRIQDPEHRLQKILKNGVQLSSSLGIGV